MRAAVRSCRSRLGARAGIAVLLGAFVLPLHAIELSVLSAGAVEPGIRPALAAFESESGHTVRIDFAAAPALRTALRAAPAADVIIIPQGTLDELVATGTAVPGARAPIGRVGVGVAVRPGVDPPDIGSADALKAACCPPTRSCSIARRPASTSRRCCSGSVSPMPCAPSRNGFSMAHR